MDRKKQVRIFSSFEEENTAEHHRCANMTSDERCQEFALLQERRWGAQWTSQPMVKTIRFETVDW
jgi:hypothetical protein